AECGISGEGRSSISATVHDCRSANSAFRTPHSAFMWARAPEVRVESEARTRDPGRFGPYGGRYVPETLMAALEELDRVHGAGQRGVATATVCARFGLECVVYMGEADMQRQRLNVYRMELMGARVVPVTSGTRTLKDATNEALRDWVTNVTTTHYIIGSVVGPDPFPRIVRDFQSVIGREARAQTLERWGKLPSTVVACVGGGSNAMGIFSAFLDDRTVALVGVEAAGEGLESGRHAASLGRGRPGVFHGSLSYLLQNAD